MVIWGDFKVMFELDLKSEVWKMIENYDVTAWILYSSCGVHLIKFEGLHIFLLVDKVYPLTHAIITKILDRKLQADHQNEMAYQLLKLMVKDTTARQRAVVSGNMGKEVNDVKASGNPQQKEYKEKGVINSGCSRHMIGNKCYLTEYEDYDGGFVSFGDGKGIISGKEAARTMLVDSKFTTTFWAEVVNTACYVLNKALVTKPHNKTPYELIRGIPPLMDFMKPFGCSVTILNTRDNLGKFEGKADEGFFVGYSMVRYGLDWLFDINSLTIYMNYVPVVVGNQTNGIAGTRDNLVAGQDEKKKELEQEYILIPIYTTDPLISQGPKDRAVDDGKKATKVDKSGASDKDGQDDQVTRSEFERLLQQERQNEHLNSTNSFNTISLPISTAGPSFANTASPSLINVAETPASTKAFEEHPFEHFSPFKNVFSLPYVPYVTPTNDTRIFGNPYDDEVVEEKVDMNNVDSSYIIPDVPLTKFLKDLPKDQAIGSLDTPVQTRQMGKINEEHGLISSVQNLRRTNHTDFQNCLFACFLSQMEPKKPVQAIKVPTIGNKWVFRNKNDERGIVVKNKAILVAQGHTQEEGIDYDEVFAPVARIEAIRLFLAYASFKDFVVYQMDVKSTFLYGKIEEEVYVCQPPSFEDPYFPDKVYKVEKALYGLHLTPRAWYETLSTYLLDNGFHRGQIDKTLFIKRQKDDILLVQVYVDDIIFGSTKKELIQYKSDGIFISQAKYVAEILKKFDFATVKIASTPMEPNKPLIKDAKAEDVDVHLYRSMIRSLMYLTASRPDITFAMCACIRFPFDLQAFSNSDYARASLDRKSTTRGCQFLGKRLISWQCKNQTIVANSTTEAEYVAATNCYRQFWRTASTRTLNNSEIELIAIVDGQNKTITEESVRRHLKMADAKGISTLPTTEIFQQLALMGKTRTRTRRMGIRIPQSNVPTNVADEAITKEMHDRLGRAITTASSLEAEQGSESVTSLENELTRTKVVYNKALLTLTKRVKKLEKQLKHKRSRVVIHSSEDEEPSLDVEDSPKQGRMIEEIDKDENVNLVKSNKQGEAYKIAGHILESEFSTASPQKDDDDATLAETLLNIKRSAVNDKGKAISQEFKLPKKIKKRERIQISFNEELAHKLYAKELAKDSKIEKEVMKISGFDLQQESSNKQKLDEQVEVQVDSDQEEDEMKNSKRYTSMINLLQNIDREDLETLWKLVKAKYRNTRPEEAYERVLWGDLKVMFEPDIESEVWRNL
ncbi:putative ribonuclease H-like domain-containing protein [Tanacetum coccineum]